MTPPGGDAATTLPDGTEEVVRRLNDVRAELLSGDFDVRLSDGG